MSRHHNFFQYKCIDRDDTWKCSFCGSVLVGTINAPPKPNQVVAQFVRGSDGQKRRVDMTCEEVAVLRIHAS